MANCLLDISGYSDIQPLAMIDLLYPIGSVVLRSDSVNPSTLYTGTTWVQIGTKLAVSENVFGNGKTLAFTNGTLIAGFNNNDNTSNRFSFDTTAYNKAYGTGVNLQSTLGNSWLSIGVPTKAKLGANVSASGLIVETETIYSWKRTA